MPRPPVWQASPFPRDSAQLPSPASRRATACHVAQFCPQNMLGVMERAHVQAWPESLNPLLRPQLGLRPGASAAAVVQTAAPTATWSHTVETAGPLPPPPG